MNSRRLLTLACFLCAAAFVVAALPRRASARTYVAVASTTQVADFARQVAGDDMVIHCILAPGADPHTYVPTPGDVALVTGADITVQNGLHLEGNNWMAKLAKDAGKPLIVCTEGMTPLSMEYEGRNVKDPHAWFDPANAAVYVKNIERAFSELDPAHADNYRARAQLYLSELRVLDGWMRAQFSQIPPEERVLVTSHDAFNYFCRAFRFNPRNDYLSLAPVGWSTGSEVGGGMTPSSRLRVVNSLKESGARAVFVETSVNPKLLRQIAVEAGVAIGGLLYSDSMGEEDSAGETYLGMMRENTLTIVRALLAPAKKDGQ